MEYIKYNCTNIESTLALQVTKPKTKMQDKFSSAETMGLTTSIMYGLLNRVMPSA